MAVYMGRLVGKPATATGRGAFRLRVVLLGAAMVQLLVPGSLAAQIRGSVYDSYSQPLEGAVVELWGEERRITASLTDERGRFSFPERLTRGAKTLRAGQLGYRQAVVEIQPGVAEYLIRLQESPIAIPGVTVEMEGGECGRGDDSLVRAYWEAMNRHYRGGLDTLGLATYMAVADDVVERDHVGPLALPDTAVDQRGASGLLWFRWSREFRGRGYAYSVIRTDSVHSFESWSYPPLEAELAYHFGDTLFARLHRFIMADEDPEGWTLFFCPREEDRPEIEGRLRIARDSSLVWAEWTYLTPEPLEEAGGRAIFPNFSSEATRPLLLPSEGITWRKRPGGGWLARHQRYEGWIMAAGDSVPFLPDRREPRGFSPPPHSHSMVPGGLEVMSSARQETPGMERIRARRSWRRASGSRTGEAVIARRD
jgi:hypothetical protein